MIYVAGFSHLFLQNTCSINSFLVFKSKQLASFKGTVSRDFLLQVFLMNHLPPSPWIGSFRIFSKIRGDIRKSRCTTGVNDTNGKLSAVSTTPTANLPPVSLPPHWWQIMETISGCRNLKVNLKAKIYIYVSSTTQRWPNKIIKIFLIEDFSISISPRIFEKNPNGLNGILWGWGKLIHEKNQKPKILVTLYL